MYLLVPLVLWGGVVKSHRKIAARIQARLAEVALPARTASPSGTKRALRVLLPVDGTGNAQAAVRHVLDEYQRNHELQVHLLNVQAPFSRHIARFASTRDRAAFHRERAEKALAPARGLLDAANVPCRTHCAVGNRAQIVSDMAHDLNCDHIVLAAARKNSLTRMIEDSTTDRVLELTQVPVEVIPGVEVSKFERYGVPLALVLTLALIIVLLLR
ncbi:MAG TPA: universal stress protein [Burkholderiaceae bacterium]|nr:universal stress protein [Burkholderiaceae bacterium]